MKRNSILLFLIACSLSLISAEIFVRLVRPQHTYSDFLNLVGKYYQKNEYSTFGLMKNYTGTEPSMDGRGPVKVTTNSEGYRATEAPFIEQENVLVIGDSFTFAVYVSDDEAYPTIIKNYLKKQNPNVRVINAGYASGFDTDQQYAWYQNNYDAIKPKIVIWGAYPGNDILGINKSAWKELNEDGLPEKWLNEDLVVNDRGILISRKASSNTVGVEYVYTLPVLRELHLAIIIGKIWNRIFRGKWHEASYKSALFDHIYGLYSTEFKVKERIFLELLLSAKERCVQNNCNFVVALHPINFMVDRTMLNGVLPNNEFENLEPVYYERLEKLLKANGMDVVNIYPKMLEVNKRFFPKNGEAHYDLNGNHFAGKSIAEFIVKNKLLVD